MFRVGSGKANITPPIGLPLSGFAVRQNRPSIAIDDALLVKAVFFESGADCCLLLSYDLLGLDFQLDAQIRARLEETWGDRLSPGQILITTTHSHSGPPTMPIAGETRVPDVYIQTVIEATEMAVAGALSNLSEAEIFQASTNLVGINHNRRQGVAPDLPASHFALDTSLDLFVFRSPAGTCLGSMVRFACHAVTMTTQHISADFPGELTRRLEQQFGAPCLFLEGTSGDSNPTTHGQDHAAMLAFVDTIMSQIMDLPARLRKVSGKGMRVLSREFMLPFAPLPSKEQTLETIAKNDRILAGDLLSPDLQSLIKEYSAWRAPNDPDVKGAVFHWAHVFREAAQLTLQAVTEPGAHMGIPFHSSLLELGKNLFIFLSGEILTPVGQHIQALAPHERPIQVISYLSPIVGYIASPADYDIGGYELDNAWLWYRMPGPFRRDIEEIILGQVSSMLAEIN